MQFLEDVMAYVRGLGAECAAFVRRFFGEERIVRFHCGVTDEDGVLTVDESLVIMLTKAPSAICEVRRRPQLHLGHEPACGLAQHRAAASTWPVWSGLNNNPARGTWLLFLCA